MGSGISYYRKRGDVSEHEGGRRARRQGWKPAAICGATRRWMEGPLDAKGA